MVRVTMTRAASLLASVLVSVLVSVLLTLPARADPTTPDRSVIETGQAPGTKPQPALVLAEPALTPARNAPLSWPGCCCQEVGTQPTTIDCDPSKNIPPGYRLESQARKGLLIPGGVLFGTSYVFSMFVAVDKTAGMSPYGVLGPNEVPYDPSLLVVPVLGPWLALDTRVSYDCPATGGRYTSAGGCPDANRQREIWTAILIADGVVQLVGATFLTLGLTVRRQLLVRADTTRAQLVPTRIGSGQGLAVVGTFGRP